VPEISVLGPGGDDEIVERNATAFRNHYLAYRVDTRDFGEDDVSILLTTQDAANRRSDICRRQPGSRNLIEQWLEQVIVVAIDDGDVERRSRQLLGGGKSPKTRPDDHDARACLRGGNMGHDLSRPAHALSCLGVRLFANADHDVGFDSRDGRLDIRQGAPMGRSSGERTASSET
jgi:hypothetical protein